jgi:transcription-repair coupling factor (superfamily II helicase)
VTDPAHPAPPLVDLQDLARTLELRRIGDRLAPGETVAVGGLWGSSQACVLAALTRCAQGPWVVIASSDSEARTVADDLETLGLEPAFFPARESFARRGDADVGNLRRRIELAHAISGPPQERPRLIVASLLSMLQPLPGASTLESAVLRLEVGQHLDPEHLLKRLVTAGFERQPLVAAPGEVSLRGDILDLYPLASPLPLRIELFDNEVESLRSFDPTDQRSVESLPRIEVILTGDTGGIEDGDGEHPARLLSPTAVWVEIEPLRNEDRSQSLGIQSPSHARSLRILEEERATRAHLTLQSLPADEWNIDTRSVQALAVGILEAPEALREASAGDERVIVLCTTEVERTRFSEHIERHGGVGGLETVVGSLARGFRLPAAGLLVVNHRELAGIAGLVRPRTDRPAHKVRAIQSFFELKLGDHVVHAVHGLARFEGLVHMSRGEGEEEHLHLVFANDVSVYVPAARIDIVQRYIGTGCATPALDRIGGQSFRKRKERVQRAIVDLASDLLEVNARRAVSTRDSWPADDETMREVIAAFPHEDTVDQAQTDEEIQADLCGPNPMDRLLCGDVGFGKTELAVRAAVRVVIGGGQVALLAPTTLLAQQHLDTFRDRLAEFPVTVEMLSRYVNPTRMREVIEDVEAGRVDILIGTHRILSADVRFAKLGLAIIDEEQRFGVSHKEHFKRLRSQIDLLTLTATPIPRTLHMSLSGVRDISALTVAPLGRQEIETRLGYIEDEELIREALLREKNRGGQVFFLHNRVASIEAMAAHISALVPECSFAIGHGQMSAGELQRVMRLFTRGEVDVLVATTIIESGLDIPAAGTIIVHRADRFGLSELHQLRGRVGRGVNKAWCLLLVEKAVPLRQAARDRLKALEEMNQLGAGFAISMRDLEIRGAGNVLGAEQSGHIAAVGYDLYCRLLKQTIERMHAGENLEALASGELADMGVELELGIDAYLPEDWIRGVETRLELLRELADIDSEESLDAAEAMLRDRFGRIPPQARGLLRTFRLQAALSEHGVTRLSWQGDAYLLGFADRVRLEGWLASAKVELRPIRAGLAHLRTPADCETPEEALEWIEGLLKVHPRGRRMGRERASRKS